MKGTRKQPPHLMRSTDEVVVAALAVAASRAREAREQIGRNVEVPKRWHGPTLCSGCGKMAAGSDYWLCGTCEEKHQLRGVVQ